MRQFHQGKQTAETNHLSFNELYMFARISFFEQIVEMKMQKKKKNNPILYTFCSKSIILQSAVFLHSHKKYGNEYFGLTLSNLCSTCLILGAQVRSLPSRFVRAWKLRF